MTSPLHAATFGVPRGHKAADRAQQPQSAMSSEIACGDGLEREASAVALANGIHECRAALSVCTDSMAITAAETSSTDMAAMHFFLNSTHTFSWHPAQSVLL